MSQAIHCCPKRILVVNDNRNLAESIRIVLGLCGHCVETAFTGAEGLQKARSFRPDVIICDLAVPDLDGLEIAKTVRCDPQLRRVRLIALSACDADERGALAAGFDEYVLKPAKLRELAQLLAE